ncbi:MAG: hypothetical protein R3339_06280, partial [Thermodesulfobacteriota bacterium]|nr:hypothetical protein [Thermodesulfobacteriota bacterium]
EKTFALKKKIGDYVAEERKTLTELKAKGEDPEVDVTEKENIYNQIDKLEETIDEKFEEILKECLPEAFSIVREPSREQIWLSIKGIP